MSTEMGCGRYGMGGASGERVALGLTFVAGAIAALSLIAWMAAGFRLRPQSGLEATMPPDAAALILLLAAQFHVGRGRSSVVLRNLQTGAVLLCAVAALASVIGHALAAKGFTWAHHPGIQRMPPLAGGLLFLVSEGVLFSLLGGGTRVLCRVTGAVLTGAAWLAAVTTGFVECLRHPLDLEPGASAQALLCAVCVFLMSTSLLVDDASGLNLAGISLANPVVALLGRGLGPGFMLVASVQAALSAAARLPDPDLGNALACGFALASYLGAAVAVLWLMLRFTTDVAAGVSAPATPGAAPVLASPPVELDPGSPSSLCQSRTSDELHLAVCELVTEKLHFPLAWVASVHAQPPCLQVLCYSGDPGGLFKAGSEPVRWNIPRPEAFFEFLRDAAWMVWNPAQPSPLALPWLSESGQSRYSGGVLLPLRIQGKLWGVLAAMHSENSVMAEPVLNTLRRAADTVACVMARLAEGKSSRELAVELERSRFRLDQMAAVVPGIIYQLRVGSDGVPRYTYISPRAAEFGLSTDPDHPDWRLGELIHPDDRNRFFEAVARSIMERKDFFFEGRAVVKGQVLRFTARSLISIQEEALVFDGIVSGISNGSP